MRAVNLVPRETRRPGLTSGISFGPSYAIVAGLLVALVLMVVLVLTDNTISDRQAKLASVRSQLAAEQVVVARLAAYQRFSQLAQARITTVRQIVGTRFDWHGALADLSKVVPANASLQSLDASVSPSSAGGSSAVRSDITSPAFDLSGCTRSQDDVARLMSRLRLMDGVTRVTLQSSTGSIHGTTSNSPTGACAGGPSFRIVVFFAAPAGTATSPTPTTGAAR